jgi:phage minor structural protein, N-terminal domain protein
LVQVAKSPINDFSFTSDITDRRTINTKEVETLYSVLMDGAHSIVGTWEGELVRDNFAISIKRNRGEDRGVIISTHKNLKSYQRTKNSQNVVTRIHAKSTFKAEGAKEDTTIAITVDSPLIGAYPYINERSYTNNNIQTVEELTKWASAKFTNEHIDKATDAIKIEAYELDGQTVHMGDTVNLKSYKHNVDVYKKAIAYEYDCLANNGQGAYLTITFDDKVKSGGNGGGVSAVANAILDKQETQFDIMLERAIANADRAFDAEFAKREKAITDGIELAKAKAEEVKQELSDTINQRFDSFDNGPLKEAKRKAEEALKNAGASNSLAQEAKQIGLDSIAKLEAFKSQTTTAQTALSGDLDALKQTVTSEVNQASEHRRTTTEALSRMTGQMDGFATKSEVKQGIDGLTQTFAKMQVGGRNYYRDSEKVRTSTRFFSFPLHPYLSQENIGETWTLSFDLKINEGGEIRPLLFYHYQNNRFGLKASAYITPSKEWQRFTFTGPVIFPNDDSRYSRGEMALYDYAGNNNYSVRRIKLEKGTLATDWSPAVEDTDGLITEAKATFERTAQGLRTDLSAIQEYVNKDGQRQEALQSYAREESAKQATAVRELVTKDYVGKATYQETVRAIENKFEAITNPQNGSIATQIANYKKSVDGRFADITSLISGKANQTDFQRVKETSQLYERILGNTENGIADKVARMAMTNQLFQVEVGKAFAEHQNLFLNSTLTKGFLGNNGIIYVANATQKEVTSDFISVDPNEKIIFQHWVTLPENGMAWTAWQFFDKNKNPIDNRKPGLNAYKTTVGKQHNINQITVPANAYFVRFSARMYDDGLIKVEKGSTPSDYSVAPNDALEAVKTVQRQLDGSWAVQNINSAGDIISGINLGATGHNRITGKLTHITGDTLIDKAVIKSAMIDKLKTANFESGSVTTEILDAEAVTADKVRFDNAFIRKMITNEAFIEQLTSKQIFATKVESVVSSSTFLEAYQGRIGGFTIGHFDQGRGRWISGVNQFSVGMGNGEGGSYNGENTAFWANWGYNWNSPGPNAWYVTTSGNMHCRNGAAFHGKVDFSDRSTVSFYSQPFFSKGAVINGDLSVSGHITYNGGEWIYSPRYKQLRKATSQGSDWLYLDIQGNNGSDWIHMNKAISDRRYKSNIQESQVSGLDVINNLKTYSYRKKYDGKVEDISCGIMAQDVQKYAPEAFYKNPDGAYTYETFALVPYLIKAIQELNQKIEKMEKTIA